MESRRGKCQRDWTMRRTVRKTLIAAVAGLGLTAVVHAADPDCVPWSSAGPVIAKNSLLPANVIYKMVQSRTGGQVVHQSLCKKGGRFFYKLVVLGPKGDVSNLTVDARTGQP